MAPLRVVALKLLRHTTPERIQRFERERAAQVQLGVEAGFVPLWDAGTSEQGVYLAMPLLTGGTLEERLRRGPLTREDAITLARSLAFWTLATFA